MGNADEKLQIKADVNLEQLVILTKDFIELADSLYNREKLSREEYNELTFLKKDFLKKVEKREIY